MLHATPLIGTLVAGFTLALLIGMLARQFRLPTIVGYIAAGVLIGPHTPGIKVADTKLALELAELGVILLMFKVGLKFSASELKEVRAVAIPGALLGMAGPTSIGWLLAQWWGWGAVQGAIFGLCLGICSTVVLLRALTEAGIIKAEKGRIALGWVVVEDAVVILALVLLPVAAGLLGQVDEDAATFAVVASELAITIGKAAFLVAVMLVAGRRVLPAILRRVAETGNGELFNLAALVLATGIAYISAKIFGVSFALGAFLAGLALAGSPLSQKAADNLVPFRDAFSVLFFVSVGMLFDPSILYESPIRLMLTVGAVLLGKAVVAYAWMRICGYERERAMILGASLTHIGEFSFILAGTAVLLGLMPEEGRDLILATAIFLISIHSPLFNEALRRSSVAGVMKTRERDEENAKSAGS